ncbi:MAG: RND family transporter, partial [Kordiimonas sp.]
ISTIIPSLFVILFSVVCGMAFGGFMGWKMTPMSSPIPLMILILAVADCVHVVTSILQNMRQGMDRLAATRESLRINFGPIAATSITTAIGFLTMNFSSSDSLGNMGSQVAFGVMVAFILSVTLLPASICLLPVKVKVKPENNVGAASAWHQKLVQFIDNSRKSILASSLLLIGFLGYGVSQNILNDKFHTYFSEETPFRQAVEFTDKHMGGTYNVSYNLHATAVGGVSSPAFLKRVELFAEWLRSQPEVIQVYNVADTFKRLNKDMHGGDTAFYSLPESSELAAQYLLLYELSLPYGLDLNDQINFEKSATRIQVSLKSLSTLEMLAFEKRTADWLANSLPKTRVEGSSVQVMFSHMARIDVEGMLIGTLLALVLISGLLVFVFKSLRIGLISLIPNLLPTIAAFGIWGLFVGEVGLGLAMVSGLTMGVVVDDTIHFLSKYQRARTKHYLSVTEALEYAFSKAGVSILVTSTVLFAGFIVMIFAQFRLNADLGLMTAIIIVLALVFDFILLPVLLLLFDRRVASEPQNNKLSQSVT